MRLRNLFEAPKSFDEIEPGARDELENISNLRDLEVLNQKIHDYESTLTSMSWNKVPKSARETLNKLKSDVQSTLDHLHQKRVEVEAANKVGDIPKGVFNLLETIKTECSQIVDAYKITNRFLYRGVKSNSEAFKGKPFNERRAKDSDKKLSAALNQAFADAGIEARRDNSIFTSSSIGQASGYGNTYVIFPVNGFSFSYSKKIKDFVFDISGFRDYFLSDLKNEIDQLHKEIASHGSEVVTKYFDDNYSYSRYLEKDYLFGDVNDFAAVGAMIDAGLVDEKFRSFASINSIMTPEKAIEKLQINHTDLNNAIKSGHEVVIRGNYYAISTKFESEIKSYFNDHVEQSEESKAAAAKEFEMGQGVEYTEGGKQAVVVEPSDANDDFVTVLDLSTGEQSMLPKAAFKKIDIAVEPQEVKVGDRVIVIKPHSKAGKVGTVDYVWSSGKSSDIRFSSGPTIEIANTQFVKLASDAQSSSDSTSTEPADDNDNSWIDSDFLSFEVPAVGDTVKITASYGPYSKYKNKIGKVISITSGISPIAKVQLEDGEVIEVPEEYAVKIKTPAKPASSAPPNLKFKIGDMVNVTNPKGSKKYKVIDIDQNGVTLQHTLYDTIVKRSFKLFYQANPELDPNNTANDASNHMSYSKKMKLLIAKGKQAGHLTYADIDKVFPAGSTPPDQLDDIFARLDKFKIHDI
jgi:hypothetical protein